jgi:hypothetical protein
VRSTIGKVKPCLTIALLSSHSIDPMQTNYLVSSSASESSPLITTDGKKRAKMPYQVNDDFKQQTHHQLFEVIPGLSFF